MATSQTAEAIPYMVYMIFCGDVVYADFDMQSLPVSLFLFPSKG